VQGAVLRGAQRFLGHGAVRHVAQEDRDRRGRGLVEVLHRELVVLIGAVGRAHRHADARARARRGACVGERVDRLDDVVGVNDLEERTSDEGLVLVDEAGPVTAREDDDAVVIEECHRFGEVSE
jgi:hypothetical protein